MLSFRTELENPVVEKDIIELEQKIQLFKEGQIDEEKFRSLRLARGVYGQRQPGVQMIRIKLPYGKITAAQWRRIAQVSDEYSTGNLHFTTRQDIQIHYVSLDRTPELWAELEKDDITLREACGNTIRNITASPLAGVDPDEVFDVSPYAEATFAYFLRNPINQEMGRKFKIAFSSSEKDTAFTFIHDLGLLPKIKEREHGFKVLLGGGLGAQPLHAHIIEEFLPANRLIPMVEGIIRVFERYGERSRRMKARLKFLIEELGLDQFLALLNEELKALPNPTFEIDYNEASHFLEEDISQEEIYSSSQEYKVWKLSNVSTQKQNGFKAVSVKVPGGNISSSTARKIAELVDLLGYDDVRITPNQGFIIRFVPASKLGVVYKSLKQLNLAEPGFDSIHDITACPGTDTCNLGISSSTGTAKALEHVLKQEYQDLIHTKDLSIKISGCMNACGQHSIANIGFQGMTIKTSEGVAPALQILLGGGIVSDGQGRFADKVIKIPSKRATEALRSILNDYEKHSLKEETFNHYYDRQGKIYFYDLLKELASREVEAHEYLDWGYETRYVKAIGLGECAGAIVDLVATLLLESDEKIINAQDTFKDGKYADSVYHSYSAFVNTAKALLTSKGVQSNNQISVIRAFDKEFIETGILKGYASFADLVLRIKENRPTQDFAEFYLEEALSFQKKVVEFRSLKK